MENTISVRIQKDAYRLIQKIAKAEGRTYSGQLKAIVKEYSKRKKIKK